MRVYITPANQLPLLFTNQTFSYCAITCQPKIGQVHRLLPDRYPRPPHQVAGYIDAQRSSRAAASPTFVIH